MSRSAKHPIERCLRRWQKRMLLGDWKITVEVGALDDGSRADCDAKPEYREALIRLNPALIPVEEYDAFCVDELVHCKTWRLETVAEEWGQSESRYAFVRDIAETTVDSIARVILNVAKR